MTRLAYVVIALTAAAGCGGGTHVDGTIKGGSFAAADAVSAVFTQSNNGVTTTSAAILVSTTANVCDVVAGGHTPGASQSMMVNLFDVDPASGAMTAPTRAGTYTVTGQTPTLPAHAAGVAWIDLDAACNKSAQAVAVSGTVTLSSASSAGSYAGSFDVTLDSGDHVSGHFDSVACSAFGAQLENAVELPCG